MPLKKQKWFIFAVLQGIIHGTFETSHAFSPISVPNKYPPASSKSAFLSSFVVSAIDTPSSRLKRVSLRSNPITKTNEPNKEDEVTTKNEDQKSLQQTASVFLEMAVPYYKESKAGRWLFAGMIGMTLLNSGVSVAFSYVGKDFWNALSSKGW